MTMQEASGGFAAMRKRLLIPIDFSEHSLDAVQVAKELALDLNAELTLIHVLAPGGARRSVAPGQSKPPPSKLLDADAKQGEALKHVRQSLLSELDDVTLQLVSGESAAEAIADQAERMHADFIVMSTGSHPGLGHRLAGSMALAVIRHAPCPVVVVPPARPRPASQPNELILEQEP
jgi:nucleotide-binding universal stress UspA family protein